MVGRTAPPDQGRPDWERRRAAWQHHVVRVHRSFAFVDVSGFTALTELEGDERAVDVLTAFRALLRDICARRGVRIAKWLGDGVMLVCVTTRPLLETILEIHYVVSVVSGPVETVSIRSGLTAGEVILMEGDDYIGHSVNVAARLCDQAPAGEALAAPSVMDDLPAGGWLSARPRSPCAASRNRFRRRASRWPRPDRMRCTTRSADCPSATTPPRRSPTTYAARSCSSARRVVWTPGAGARRAPAPPEPSRHAATGAAARLGPLRAYFLNGAPPRADIRVADRA